MKLWLDDIRDPKRYGLIGWTWVKTVDEAISALENHRDQIEEASLDHDLSVEATMGQPKPEEKTGYDVVLWMERNMFYPLGGVSVHSMNPSGGDNMLLGLEAIYRRCLAMRDIRWDAVPPRRVVLSLP